MRTCMVRWGFLTWETHASSTQVSLFLPFFSEWKKALQLLSNTQPLTDYFLSGLHIKEMTENNPFGSQGNVVYQFGLLLKFFEVFGFLHIYFLGSFGSQRNLP